MQSVLFRYDRELSDVDTMAVTEKRVHTIESELGQVAQRVAKLEGHKEAASAPDKSNTVLIVLLSVLGAGLVAYWGWLGIEVVTEGRQISQILAILSPDIIRKAAAEPSPQNVKQVEKIVQRAIKQGERINPDLVFEAGTKFVDASKTTPDAWQGAIALLDYKSFLNTSLSDVPVIASARISLTTNYRISQPPGITNAKAPSVKVIGAAPKELAAQMDYIGQEQNAESAYGNQYVVVEGGGGVALDNMHLKNIVFVNTRIYYDKGPLVLDNVYFLNCTFVLTRSASGLDLAKAILEKPASTNFTAS